MLDVFEQRM